ncbi:MAG: hypothetical protein LAP85_22990 [Acidobacteriia bacterium]|nr:hypothetical protein [Terriglobia bacterium]
MIFSTPEMMEIITLVNSRRDKRFHGRRYYIVFKPLIVFPRSRALLARLLLFIAARRIHPSTGEEKKLDEERTGVFAR